MSLRGLVQRLLLVALSTCVTVALFEIILRLGNFLPEYRLTVTNTGMPAWSHRLILDPTLLYRVASDTRGESKINSFGYRDREFTLEKTNKKRILILGDSFIMGNNVEPWETIPAVLQQQIGPDFEVYNMGIAGYGPDQLLLRYEQEGRKFHADLVVLSLFAGNDFRDVGNNHLFQVSPEGNLQRTTTNPVTNVLPWLRTTMLVRVALTGRYLVKEVEDKITDLLLGDKEERLVEPDVSTAQERRKLMKHILVEFGRTVTTSGSEFMIMIVPSFVDIAQWSQNQGQSDASIFSAERALLEDCEELKFSCLPLLPAVQAQGGVTLYDPLDRHFSQHGTAAMAQELKVFLMDHYQNLFAPALVSVQNSISSQ